MPADASNSAPDAAQRIATDLWRRVRVGDLAEGDLLREAELAERYGNSRHTVRAALRQLRAEGLVEHDRHRSARIRLLTAADIRDLFAVRRLLELEAVRRMIEEDAPLSLLAASVDEIERIEALRGGADAPSPEEIDVDLDFHRALVASVGSPRLAGAYETLVAETRLAFVSLAAVPVAVSEHRPILAAIAARDLPLATRLLDAHLRDGLRICLARRA